MAAFAGCAIEQPRTAENNKAEVDSTRNLAGTDLPFKVEGIDVVQISAPAKSDLHKWYQENLGLKVAYGNEGWQQFKLPAGSAFAINYSQEDALLKKQRLVTSFKVSSIRAAVRHMLSGGVKFLNPQSPIHESGRGYVATFYDPQGNLLQTLEDKQ